MPNLFKEIPNELPSEIFEDIYLPPTFVLSGFYLMGIVPLNKVGMIKMKTNGC